MLPPGDVAQLQVFNNNNGCVLACRQRTHCLFNNLMKTFCFVEVQLVWSLDDMGHMSYYVENYLDV